MYAQLIVQLQQQVSNSMRVNAPTSNRILTPQCVETYIQLFNLSPTYTHKFFSKYPYYSLFLLMSLQAHAPQHTVAIAQLQAFVNGRYYNK